LQAEFKKEVAALKPVATAQSRTVGGVWLGVAAEC
jgi:hypothetical protein